MCRPLSLVGGILFAGWCLIGLAASDPPNADPTDAVVAWVKENAVPLKTVNPGAPLDDLQKLRDLVGDARVVLLGESRHDARQHFQLKHRIIDFLVREMGFTLLAMEESLANAGKVNDYILGAAGRPEALLNHMGAWYIFDTVEVLALVKWMRQYNVRVDPPQKLRFFGIDISDARLAIDNVLAYLAKVDPEYARVLRKKLPGLDLFSADMWPQTVQNYSRLSGDALDDLEANFRGMLARFEQQRASYVSQSSPDQFEWVLRQARAVERANAMFFMLQRGSYQQAGVIREKAMVDNVRWLLEREGNPARIVVWMHNFHVARSPLNLNIPNRPPAEDLLMLGALLGKELGNDLVSIGFSFNRGADRTTPLPAAGEDTVDGVLARAGLPLFLLDLRCAPRDGVVHDWLDQEQTMRGEGGLAELVPARAYDALIFTERLSPTVRSPLARRRLEAMRQP